MDRLQQLLSGLENVRPDNNGYNAKCPVHEDNENSLVIGTKGSRAGDGRILVHCQAGCDVRSVVMAAGMSMGQLFPERIKERERGGWAIRNAYDYHDADGNLIYQVCRLEPLPNEKKPFRQRQKTADGWKWGMKGVERTLYRLPGLLASGPGKVVWICEGEKDADRLIELGLVATCNPGGADKQGKKWLSRYSDLLKGRKVVLLPDNDPPDEHGQRTGLDFMRHVAESLAGKAESIRLLELPGLPRNGDVSDWLDAGGTKEELIRLARAVQPGIPDRPPEPGADDPALLHFERKLLEELGIDVLGETDEGKIKLFSGHHRKTVEVARLNFLSYADLQQGFGPVIKSKVSSDDTNPDTYSMAQVRNAIGLLAGFTRLSVENEVGPGVWRGMDERDDKPPSIVLVGAGEGAVLNGQPNLRRITQPRYGGLVLSFERSNPWFQFGQLAEMVDDWNTAWSHGVVRETEEIFDRWRWQHQEIDPALITGLALATWVQTIWSWRPQVIVSGKSKAGKTVLFDCISNLFGNLSMKSSHSSAAGLQQAIAQSARVAIVDEFDSSKNRRAILEMLRGSGRGDMTLKGTTSHKSVQFKLRHIVWVAGIDTGLQEEADMYRFIHLQLVRPEVNQMGKLQVPPEWKMQELGQKLLATALRCAVPGMALAARLVAAKPEGVDFRTVESFAVPVAMYAVATGADDDQAISWFHQILDSRRADAESFSDDEESLISDILDAKVRYAGNKEASVAALIKVRKYEDDAPECLERNGIIFPDGHFDHDGEPTHVFIAHNRVSHSLLGRTRWDGHNISEILGRVDGASKCRKRDSSRKQSRGVLLPIDALNL